MVSVARGTGRPKGYFALDGEKVPSVTTVTGRFKESGGLIYWANQEGLNGRTLDEARDEATGIGSLVHAMVEAEIHGRPEPLIPPAYHGRVMSALSAWHEWRSMTRLEIVATEVPLVSEKHRYGGTLDAVGRDAKGRLCLPDWKSANAVYGDYLLQLSAYAELWNESNEEPITGGFHLVRFSKEHGDLETRFYPELDDALRMFLLLRSAYDFDKTVKARAK